MPADEGPKDDEKEVVMFLSKKMEVLCKLDRWMSTATFGRNYGVNKSTICSVKKNESQALRRMLHRVRTFVA